MNQIAHIPEPINKKRVVIVGAGFAGLKVARNLADKKDFQVVLLDINNYHQFQPLFYQVATGGLEPSSISFPLRKVFQKKKNVHFRVAKVEKVLPKEKQVITSIGDIDFDYLVLAYGTTTNYFGNANIQANTLPMKATTDSIQIRNTILTNFESALSAKSKEEEEALISILIVGGGPTGVELAGAMAEMRKYVLPKDYPELDFHKMKIHLLEGSPRLLGGMSDKAAKNALKYLKDLGVIVKLNSLVADYDGLNVTINDGASIKTHTLLWAAGVKADLLEGLPRSVLGPGNRLQVDRFNKVEDVDNVYAIGDLALMKTEKYPNGHPQVAQPAIQQGDNLSKNLIRKEKSQAMRPFHYVDKGSLATIGRNLAVADLPFGKFKGFVAWLLWLFVHLMYLVGVKNRLFVFLNWSWSYITYDQSLRLVIKSKANKK